MEKFIIKKAVDKLLKNPNKIQEFLNNPVESLKELLPNAKEEDILYLVSQIKFNLPENFDFKDIKDVDIEKIANNIDVKDIDLTSMADQNNDGNFDFKDITSIATKIIKK